MSPDQVFDRVRAMLVSEFEVPEDQVTPAADLGRDLDLDSIDAVTLASRLEEETGLSLTEEELKSMRTVQQVTDWMSSRLEERSA
jgi:acyl carrier protein